MEIARIGSALGAAMNASRHSASLRAAEKRLARQCSLWQRAARKECARPSWRARIDANIDTVFACAACVMLGWLIHKWL
jgi:hypothetical protein